MFISSSCRQQSTVGHLDYQRNLFFPPTQEPCDYQRRNPSLQRHTDLDAFSLGRSFRLASFSNMAERMNLK